jgi:hypothetical protein
MGKAVPDDAELQSLVALIRAFGRGTP